MLFMMEMELMVRVLPNMGLTGNLACKALWERSGYAAIVHSIIHVRRTSMRRCRSLHYFNMLLENFKAGNISPECINLISL